MSGPVAHERKALEMLQQLSAREREYHMMKKQHFGVSYDIETDEKIIRMIDEHEYNKIKPFAILGVDHTVLKYDGVIRI